MSRNNYHFPDVSHWNGPLNHQDFASAGHRLGIVKASDTFHMPDKAGNYDFGADRHYDAYFLDNYLGFRSVGMAVGAYHFVRWGGLTGATMTQYPQLNLDHFLSAVDQLPPDERLNVVCPILDMEQSEEQLRSAGYTPKGANMQAVTLDIADAFLDTFQKGMIYSGNWWMDWWLTEDTLQKLAEKFMYWEAEYPSGALNLLDKSTLSSLRWNYIPSVPKAFEPVFMTSKDDGNGKLFGWQWTSSGRINGQKCDLNVTELPKADVFDIFQTDGSVDPPNPPDGEMAEQHAQILLEMGNGFAEVIDGQHAIEDILRQHMTDFTKHEQNLASAYLDIMAELGSGNGNGGTEPPNPGEKKLYARVANDGKNVYLMYPKSMNQTPRPVYEFYPTSTAPVRERVFVGGNGGQYIPILSRNIIKGDGGFPCYEIDRDRLDEIILKFGSAPIPTQTEMKEHSQAPNDWAIRWFLAQKYVVEIVEK